MEYLLYSFREQELVKVTACRHIFHTVCLDDWLRAKDVAPTCPECRHNPFLAPAPKPQVLVPPSSRQEKSTDAFAPAKEAPSYQ